MKAKGQGMVNDQCACAQGMVFFQLVHTFVKWGVYRDTLSHLSELYNAYIMGWSPFLEIALHKVHTFKMLFRPCCMAASVRQSSAIGRHSV